MISDKQKLKLMTFWGDQAESMACMAEVRVYDPLSDWQCYIYAVNPNNDDEIMCLICVGKGALPMPTHWTLSELKRLYNSQGEGVEVDREYRPRRVDEIYKKLSETGVYGSNRD